MERDMKELQNSPSSCNYHCFTIGLLHLSLFICADLPELPTIIPGLQRLFNNAVVDEEA